MAATPGPVRLRAPRAAPRAAARPALAGLLSAAAALLPSIPALGADTPRLAPPQEVTTALTLYVDGRSWVSETASVSLTRGDIHLPWPRAAATLEPDTLSARVLEGQARVTGTTPPRRLEDVGTLLRGWIGHEVELVQVGEDLTEKLTRGVLVGLSGDRPLLRGEDWLWVDPPGTLRLPIGRDPAALIATQPDPALVRLDASGGGRARIELSYRASGLSWSAQYRAVRGAQKLDFEGWVTLRNDTEIDFRDARVRLLAGELERRSPFLPGALATGATMLYQNRAEAAEPATRQALETTYLYTLEGGVDLPPSSQTRRLWVSRRELPARLRHRLESPPGVSYGGDSGAPPVHPFAILSIPQGALGDPLPAGVVRVFEEDSSGRAQETGEDLISHLPAGAPFDLRTGRAFDLSAERRLVEEAPRGGGRGADLACEIRVRNAGKSEASVEVRESFNGSWRVEQSSHPARRVDARTAEFILPVPAGGEAVLTYRASVRY